MKVNLYSIKDIKVAHRAPMVMHNDEEAKRACQFAVNSGDKASELFLCPQDFELWRVGEYDDITGEIIPCHEFICNLSDLKKSEVRDA